MLTLYVCGAWLSAALQTTGISLCLNLARPSMNSSRHCGLRKVCLLADQILRGHGVAPRCESRPGQGTCVSFQMPLAESHAQSQASAVAQPVDDTSPASAAVAAQSHTADMLFCGATSGAATVLCPGEQDKDSSLGAWDPQVWDDCPYLKPMHAPLHLGGTSCTR